MAHATIPLSPLGVAQAATLADLLDVQLSKVLVSKYLRARRWSWCADEWTLPPGYSGSSAMNNGHATGNAGDLTDTANGAASAMPRFAQNIAGRDFAVGDIHGCFTELQRGLDAIGFNPNTDRLFSVGDLVDRGPESHTSGTERLKAAFRGSPFATLRCCRRRVGRRERECELSAT